MSKQIIALWMLVELCSGATPAAGRKRVTEVRDPPAASMDRSAAAASGGHGFAEMFRSDPACGPGGEQALLIPLLRLLFCRRRIWLYGAHESAPPRHAAGLQPAGRAAPGLAREPLPRQRPVFRR